MGASTPSRRSHTARELGNRFNRSPRTVRRVIAEPREAYLSRAQQRHTEIRRLRAEGLSMRAIAAKVGCTVGTVHYALSRAMTGEKDIA